MGNNHEHSVSKIMQVNLADLVMAKIHRIHTIAFRYRTQGNRFA